MKKINEFLSKIIPQQALLPTVILIVLQFVAFYVPKIININRPHHLIETSLDKAMPLIPVFVVFYILAFLQWIVFYLILAREEDYTRQRFYVSIFLAKIICMLVFISFPTQVNRPEITGTGFFNFLCKTVFFFDAPNNVLPSMHCLESWFCVRLAILQLNKGRMYGITNSRIFTLVYALSTFVLSVLVFMSTFFTKQHSILDFFGAVVVAEITFFIGSKIAGIFRKKHKDNPEDK